MERGATLYTIYITSDLACPLKELERIANGALAKDVSATSTTEMLLVQALTKEIAKLQKASAGAYPTLWGFWETGSRVRP